MKYRKYVIAGITIELPDTLPGGHFARAIETFAAGSASKGADGLPAGSTHPAATAPVPPAATPADTTDPEAGATIADTAPALRLAPGICPPAQADYRELDSLDFADADADCRLGIDAAGHPLRTAPRRGPPPARGAPQGPRSPPPPRRRGWWPAGGGASSGVLRRSEFACGLPLKFLSPAGG